MNSRSDGDANDDIEPDLANDLSYTLNRPADALFPGQLFQKGGLVALKLPDNILNLPLQVQTPNDDAGDNGDRQA